MRTRIVWAAFLAALLFALPLSAYAANGTTEQTYDLDFALPTAGKSGCLVCHGDPNLARASETTTYSLYVSAEQIQASAHADSVCTGCHIDFAFKTPHENVVNGGQWRDTAKLACKSCKQHAPQAADYAAGAHSPAGKPGENAAQAEARRVASGKPAKMPLCGDCHGSHDIASMEDTAAVNVYHRTGLEVCGQCHEDYATTYADYYHGAAYRNGALDAPACWDCHGTHEILPASDRRSMVSPQRLADTCGQEGCHVGEATEEFLEYATLVHGKGDLVQENPVYAAYDSARARVRQVFETIRSWFS